MGQRGPRDRAAQERPGAHRARARRRRSRSSTGPRCTCGRTASSPSRRARRTRGRSSAAWPRTSLRARCSSTPRVPPRRGRSARSPLPPAHDHAARRRRAACRCRNRARATSSSTGARRGGDEDGRHGPARRQHPAEGRRGGQGGAGARAARRCPRCSRRQHQAEITYPDPARATTLLVWKPRARGHRLPRDAGLQRRTSTVRWWTARGIAEPLGRGARARHRQVLLARGRRRQGRRGGKLLRLRALHGQPRPRAGGRGTGDPPPPLVIESLEVRAEHPAGARAARSRGPP